MSEEIEAQNTAQESQENLANEQKLRVINDVVFDLRINPTLSKELVAQYSLQGLIAIQKVVWLEGQQITFFNASIDHRNGLDIENLSGSEMLLRNYIFAFGFKFFDGSKYIHIDVSAEPEQTQIFRRILKENYGYESTEELMFE